MSEKKKKGPGGRPPIWKSPEALEIAIEEYFKICEGEPFLDSDGNQVINKWGEPVFVNRKPPTVTGMALHLGMSGRKTLLEYEARDKFGNAITRAKARIEEYVETRLFDRDGVNGAKFNLANNFGWKDKQELEHTGAGGGPIQFQSLSDEELDEKITSLLRPEISE